jgi:GcrA cell cycle regulator
MDWTEEMIVRLRALWLEGHSTAEIGRRMAVSKNAVVGKAHRLGLAARPSPIRREAGSALARPLPPRRAHGPTLPPLACAHGQGPDAAPAALAPAAPVPPAVAAVRPVAPRPPRAVACCWPIGEPGTKSFRFCDEDAVSGKPYCAEHAQLAYVKVRDRREEAA